jgi:AcrR family transcriptional regulator
MAYRSAVMQVPAPGMTKRSSSDLSNRPGEAEDTRRLVLDKAARLFRANGYASTSLRDIAAATGTKAGSLYYYFESKEALAEEVLAQGIAAVEESVRTAIDAQPRSTDPLETIRIAMIAHLQALHAKSDYASANVRCFGHMPPEIRKRLQVQRTAYDDLWARLIEAAQAAGRLRPDLDPLALRYAVIGMLNWTLEWRHGNAGSLKALGNSFFAIAFEGARHGS